MQANLVTALAAFILFSGSSFAKGIDLVCLTPEGGTGLVASRGGHEARIFTGGERVKFESGEDLAVVTTERIEEIMLPQARTFSITVQEKKREHAPVYAYLISTSPIWLKYANGHYTASFAARLSSTVGMTIRETAVSCMYSLR